jgi:hypothetical protein
VQRTINEMVEQVRALGPLQLTPIPQPHGHEAVTEPHCCAE